MDLQDLKETTRKMERVSLQGMEGQDTGNGFPLIKSGFGLGFGKKFLPVREVMPWHRAPREAVAAPGSLAVSKARLDTGAGSSLAQWEVSLPVDDLLDPF